MGKKLETRIVNGETVELTGLLGNKEGRQLAQYRTAKGARGWVEVNEPTESETPGEQNTQFDF